MGIPAHRGGERNAFKYTKGEEASWSRSGPKKGRAASGEKTGRRGRNSPDVSMGRERKERKIKKRREERDTSAIWDGLIRSTLIKKRRNRGKRGERERVKVSVLITKGGV